MTRRALSVFSLSFLDLFSCALAAVIVLMLVFITMMEGNRSDRRRMIFTARVSVEDSRGQSADMLFTTATWQPRDWVEILLVDPNGFEKLLEPIPDGNAAYVNDSSARPAFGEWSVRLRPRDRSRAEKPSDSPLEIPTPISAWSAAYKEIDRVETNPEWLVHPIDDLLDELREGSRRPSELVAWEIASRLDRFRRLRSQGNAYYVRQLTPRRWISNLAPSLVTSAKIPDFDDIKNSFRGKTALFHVQAVALYDRLYQILEPDPQVLGRRAKTFGRWPSSSMNPVAGSDHEQKTALAMMAVHFRAARKEIDDIIAQCQIADVLRPWESGVFSRTCHEVRLLMSGHPIAVGRPEEEPVIVQYDLDRGLSILDETLQPTAEEPATLLGSGLSTRPLDDLPLMIELARSKEVTIQLAASQPANAQAPSTHPRIDAALDASTLAKNLEKALEVAGDRSETMVPALFAAYYLGDLTQYPELLEKLNPSLKSANRDANLKLAALELPSLYLSARGAAIASRRTTIRVRDVMVHWGSEILRAPDAKLEASGLSVDAPILRFGIYPAEVVLTLDAD